MPVKLYDYPGVPNPRRLNIFMSEKGIDIPRITIDLLKGKQFEAGFKAKSPNCDVPTLELDDGTCISQTNAICRYLETIYPTPPLFGTTAKDIGLIEMWSQICFTNCFQAAADLFRNGPNWFEDRALVGPHNYEKIPQLVNRGQQRIKNFYDDISHHLASQCYIAGSHFSAADITALVSIDFAQQVGAPIPPKHKNLLHWHALVSERPSVQNNP